MRCLFGGRSLRRVVSSPLSWTGVAIIVIALVLAAVITPWLALVAIIGVAVVWMATNYAGTVNSYTYHGGGHEDFRGLGANDRRRGL